MSYVKHSWIDDETITAAKLNNMEDGISEAAQSGGGALICSTEYSNTAGTYVLNKTVQEIYDAFLAGTPVYVRYQYGVLGTSYVSHTYLAPVVKIYAYDYVNNIRVVAVRPVEIGNASNKTYVHSPAVVIFSATSLDDYPVTYANTYVPTSNVAVDGSIL